MGRDCRCTPIQEPLIPTPIHRSMPVPVNAPLDPKDKNIPKLVRRGIGGQSPAC